MTNEQKLPYLYHAMPSTWKLDLAIWKGSKKFIPYTDLKTNIERNVLDDYAKRKYVIEKCSPETPRRPAKQRSRSLRTHPKTSTTRLAVLKTAPTVSDPTTPTVTAMCCRNTVVTVLPANFAIIDRKPRDDHNPFPANQQRTQHPDDQKRPPSRGENGFIDPDIYDRFGNPVNFQDLRHKFSSKGREAGLIAYMTIFTLDIGLSATGTDPHDPTWTVDSGCIRHAAYQ
ncbi:Hypothetical protein PHPALM_1321 [Phytophthora palmivora]|uniref:Uncharacterized protein n=1 Tax=Phytophthora palmivora TaxID=4796 RepID=A0A2P4YSM2_9STRA|nr:Hypothetical protein PHPALM_1321 [Phytophthora palmivora]